MMQPLLIELGTDELPVKALPGLAQAFFDGVIAGLESRGIAFDRGDAKPLYTPRRLAALLPAVADEQPEQASEVLGPYLNIALDANGQPTKALEGFATKAGIAWTQLERTTDNKGERFVHRSRRAGARTADLLPGIVREAIAAIPIPKPMRWGDHDYAFARPVHWLVLLFGNDVVDCGVMGVQAGRMSRGHRFMHDKPVWINAVNDYVAALRDASVLVDADERRDRIRGEAQQAAKTVGGHARISDDLLEEVNALVEWPVAIACKFEREFLAVPHEALISTMETNQKFFAVLDGAQQLSEHFIGIANVASKDVAEVRKGYERVIRPRFADAKFFFDEDLRQGLAAMGDGLRTVTYQAKLGSVADKVQRVAALAETIAKEVGADPAQARRAAGLSKNDLQSRMVNEFPELQGIAGRHYAAAAGEPGEIALAIDESYQPRFAGDDIALSPLGKVLAIAERLDTLAGGFAAGLKPTGNKDPFALRRNALGLARTIIESGFDLDLPALIDEAASKVTFSMSEVDARNKDAAASEARAHGASIPDVQRGHAQRSSAQDIDLYDFILDRLKGYYGDKGVPATHFNAVAGKRPHSLYDFDRRIDAIGEFAQLPEADALAAANKRIRNILRKAEGEIPADIDHALLVEPAELELGEALAATEAEVHANGHDYVAALTRLAHLRPHVDRFFDQVMVNADDLAIRRNRLALLGRLDRLLGGIVQLEALA